MLRDWLQLSDAEWAIWTRAPSEGLLWAFGAPAAVILIGLALFAWGASRRRWKAVVAGAVLVLPPAMLTAVFLETAVEARGAQARCAAPGRAEAAGRDACAAAHGGPAIPARADPAHDGFPAIQYYWTDNGLCRARVDRRCSAQAARADHAPPFPSRAAEPLQMRRF